MNKLIELLKQLERDKFYGRLEVQFRCGHADIARKEESIKLDEGVQTNAYRTRT